MSLIAELRALDDETLCFDGPVTYALIKRAADELEAQEAEIGRLRVMADEPTTRRVWDGIQIMDALFADPDHMPTVLEFKTAFDAAFMVNGKPYDVERIKAEWQADYAAMKDRATKAETIEQGAFALLSEAGIESTADGRFLSLSERIRLLVAERDEAHAALAEPKA